MNQHANIVSDHHRRILDAARRCFVRAGFHKATMQDVAAEAAMSAGNIYRYFKSKDEIVSALCMLDRADIAQSFALMPPDGDPVSAFVAIGHRHLVEDPRENAVFALDLWAEAARNPRIAKICADFDNDLRQRIKAFIGVIAAHSPVGSKLDAHGLVEFLLSAGDGLICRRARDADFDPAPHLAHLETVLRLALAGMLPSFLLASDDNTAAAPRAGTDTSNPRHPEYP